MYLKFPMFPMFPNDVPEVPVVPLVPTVVNVVWQNTYYTLPNNIGGIYSAGKSLTKF
jgi:hypothetical protein